MYDLLERASGTKQDFRPFWVQLTAYDSGTKYYTWIEQQFIPSTGALAALEGGRFGSPTFNPVFDTNNSVFTLPAFALVALANYDPNVDWRYVTLAAGSAGTSLTDEYDDGSLIFQNVNTQLWAIKDFVLAGIIVATLSITGNPTGGAFQIQLLTDSGFHLVSVNWNQDAASLKTALQATIPAGEALIVTGGNLPNAPITIVIQASSMTLGGNSLTGGTSPQPKLSSSSQPKFNTRGLGITRGKPMSVVWTGGVLVVTSSNETYNDGLLQGVDVQVWTLQITGSPTGGSFVISVNGATITVPWNSTAAALQTQLQTLLSFPPGNITVLYGSLPNAVMVIEIAPFLGPNTLTITGNSLTGGSSPTPQIFGG